MQKILNALNYYDVIQCIPQQINTVPYMKLTDDFLFNDKINKRLFIIYACLELSKLLQQIGIGAKLIFGK